MKLITLLVPGWSLRPMSCHGSDSSFECSYFIVRNAAVVSISSSWFSCLASFCFADVGESRAWSFLVLRLPGWGFFGRRFVQPTAPTSVESRWKAGRQSSAMGHLILSHTVRCKNQRIRTGAYAGSALVRRNPALSQALHRTRSL